MRVAGRILSAVLWMALICGVIGAFSSTHADAREGGNAFHKPFHPTPAIESTPVAAATSFTDEYIAAPATGVAVRIRFCARAAVLRTTRVIALVAETALDQRPPPPTLLP
jgi:hypothetical protein